MINKEKKETSISQKYRLFIVMAQEVTDLVNILMPMRKETWS